jgi:hypothetical protein
MLHATLSVPTFWNSQTDMTLNVMRYFDFQKVAQEDEYYAS